MQLGLTMKGCLSFMGPIQGPYILQLCMGPSWGLLLEGSESDPSWPSIISHTG